MLAMDFLPIQASAVPCEHVFSSVKETDTRKCNQIHPMLMEALQTLKFSFKKDRLNFSDGMMVAKKEMKKRLNKHARDDLLSQLLTGDHQVTTDKLLIMFDDESGEESDGE